MARGRRALRRPTRMGAEDLVAFLNWCGMPEFGDRQAKMWADRARGKGR